MMILKNRRPKRCYLKGNLASNKGIMKKMHKKDDPHSKPKGRMQLTREELLAGKIMPAHMEENSDPMDPRFRSPDDLLQRLRPQELQKLNTSPAEPINEILKGDTQFSDDQLNYKVGENGQSVVDCCTGETPW